MADGDIGNFAINDLRFVDFFDPNARLNFKSRTEVSLVSRDGYELVLQGDGFDFNGNNRPTDGTITQILLYDRRGDLVGRIDDVSYSLVEYYETVAVDGQSGKFTADLLSGDDRLTGGFARDHLEGYGGDDDIRGASGADLLVGGGGDDTLNGGTGNDDLDGGSGDDLLGGGSGRDLLLGFDGADTLAGGDGDDDLDGGGDDDQLDGNNGFDRLFGASGDDTLAGGAQGDRLEGGAGADTVDGGAANDRLGGGGGADALTGGNGFDTLFGDGGDDMLAGEGGGDKLDGGKGADTLDGGDGRDKLFGGDGGDTFRFDKSSHGGDEILDFKRGEDVLAFDPAGFDNLDATFDLIVGKSPEAKSGDATFLFNTRTHELFYDANGDGKGEELVATLDGVNTLDKGDFLIL